MTAEALEALRALIDFFESENITYHVTGGLAGNMYGSNWKLSDIDIEVHLGDMHRIERSFSRYIKRSTSRFKDAEFDIWLLQLCFRGIVVDVNAVEDFYLLRNNIKTKIETSFLNSKILEYRGLKVRVQSLPEIIEYKRLMNRKADVEDLMRLLG